MTSDNVSPGTVAASSGMRRASVTLGVVLSLSGVCYWAVERLLDEQVHRATRHFELLMAQVGENQAFLQRLARKVTAPQELLEQNLTPLRITELFQTPQQVIYEGREVSFSLPFSVMVPAHANQAMPDQAPFVLGMHLANDYGAFWSGSPYSPPQVFVLTPGDEFTLGIPALGEKRADGSVLDPASYQRASAELRLLLQQASAPKQRDGVHWSGLQAPDNAARQLQAYISIDMPYKLLPLEARGREVLVVVQPALTQVSGFALSREAAFFDALSLTRSDGGVLLGPQTDVRQLPEGLSFSSRGLHIKLAMTQGEHWTAVYDISYQRFVHDARWQLLGLLGLIAGSLALAWLVNRWYQLKVRRPLQCAHAREIESTVFNRAVIDTAPIGLSVIRKRDNRLLLENHLALGTSQWLLQVLDELGDGDIGESCFKVDGRYLHLRFSTARYQDQQVWICAFSDISHHEQGAAALTLAKRLAEEASRAKTIFLATMSHEIRTPLYGVLGTLELLERTSLDPRQQDYLQTIQCSSSTLLQLISDVLDVSKIESAQMPLELGRFCPLDMVEEVLEACAAAASAKGLQMYACIDVEVPEYLEGDQARIRQVLGNLVTNAIKFTDFGRVVLRLKVLERKAGKVSLQWQITDTGVGISQSQQVLLFEPFYQVRQGSTDGGAGLGLSICWRLSQLMNGQIHMVSEPGLGSSFNFFVELAVLAGSDIDHGAPLLRARPVYVRAPIKELADNVCEWLKHWGANALIAPSLVAEPLPGAVLVDLLGPPGNECCWGGPRVIASSLARDAVEPEQGLWPARIHAIRDIARAVAEAQTGAGVALANRGPVERGKLPLRVLVAEDNPINQAIIKEQLEELGCRVVLAADGQEALHLWLPGAFDAVLTDVNMPLMNGYELATALRQLDKQFPIIGVTANAMREEGERCLQVGMNAWMVKPLTLQGLWDGLMRVCNVQYNLIAAASLAPGSMADTELIEAPDQIQVSTKMRALFISTMREDMVRARDALAAQDASQLRSSLHCIRGALAVVQAQALADACGAVEQALEIKTLDQPLARRSELLFARIDRAVAAV